MKRLSPSMIVAIVALLVALGGGAIAASTLPINSVGTRQIINHSIKRIDLGTPLPRGPRGRTGLRGAQGPTGPQGLPVPTGVVNVAARVYNSSDESLPIQIAGAPVKLLRFDRVSFDTAGLFNKSHPTRLRAPIAGVYLINANVSWEVSPIEGVNRAVYVYVNGHAVSIDQRPPADETRQVVSTLYRLKVGDVVELGAAHDGPPSLNANAVGDYAPSLAMAWIAPG
jgi:hypothetical protein